MKTKEIVSFILLMMKNNNFFRGLQFIVCRFVYSHPYISKFERRTIFHNELEDLVLVLDLKLNYENCRNFWKTKIESI
jgi:hypothetical protein